MLYIAELSAGYCATKYISEITVGGIYLEENSLLLPLKTLEIMKKEIEKSTRGYAFLWINISLKFSHDNMRESLRELFEDRYKAKVINKYKRADALDQRPAVIARELAIPLINVINSSWTEENFKLHQDASEQGRDIIFFCDMVIEDCLLVNKILDLIGY